MNPISLILLNLIYKPIFNIIVVLLAIFGGSLGIAIILLTLIVRLILLKPSLHAMNMQKGMVDIQPKMKELQERHKDDPQKLWEETMKLFKTDGNMWSMLKGCKMMAIQIPVFLWLFYVIRDLSMSHSDKSDIYSFLYPFIHTGLDKLNHVFLWIDLFVSANKVGIAGLVITILAGILMWLQIKVTMINKPKTPSMPGGMWAMPGMPKIPDMSKMMWYMNMFMIFMMMMFVYTMPVGIGLYIITTTLFTVLQYSYIYRELIKVKAKILFSKKSSSDLATK